MFEARALSDRVEAVRQAHAPDVQVLDCERDFETLNPAVAEDLGLIVDALEPASYPAAWLPEDAPTLLARYASSDLTVGMPGDGSVVWTRQTDPPIVLVKPRVEGSPDSFVDFLLAEALVQVDLEVPEHFIGFFEATYPDLDRAVALDPNDTYQIAAALFDGWVGLRTRAVFATGTTTTRNSPPRGRTPGPDSRTGSPGSRVRSHAVRPRSAMRRSWRVPRSNTRSSCRLPSPRSIPRRILTTARSTRFGGPRKRSTRSRSNRRGARVVRGSPSSSTGHCR